MSGAPSEREPVGTRVVGARAVGTALAGIAIVSLGFAYWLATGGVPPSDERPVWVAQAPIAHRGLYDAGGTTEASGDGTAAPENSLAAFRRAVAAGVPIELDVRLTRDATVVVFHDDALERMTGDARRVDEVDLAAIRRLRLVGSAQTIPTLGEALEVVAGSVPLFVEIKNRGDAGPLEAAVADRLARYTGQVAVMSFNPYSLARMADRLPEIPRGQLSGGFKDEDLAGWKKLALGHLLMDWKSRPSFIAYELDRLPSARTTLQRWRGRPLLGWTADTPAEFERGRRVCDAVIFGPGARP